MWHMCVSIQQLVFLHTYTQYAQRTRILTIDLTLSNFFVRKQPYKFYPHGCSFAADIIVIRLSLEVCLFGYCRVTVFPPFMIVVYAQLFTILVYVHQKQHQQLNSRTYIAHATCVLSHNDYSRIDGVY